VQALLDPARGHGLTDTGPVLRRAPDFAALLKSGQYETLSTALRRSESTGRPVGSSAFLDRIAAVLGRDPTPVRRGPKPKGLGALSS
jgi:putative transposase